MTTSTESSAGGPKEVLRQLLGEALASPETFGAIRLFRFKALPESVLITVPATNYSRGVLALYLGHGEYTLETDDAASALERFIPRYLHALTDPIDDPQFVEVAADEVHAEIARTHSELERVAAKVMVFAFEAETRAEPSKGMRVDPAAQPIPASGSAHDAKAEGDAHLSETMFAFAERVATPGAWDGRPASPLYALAEKEPVFALIASNVLADFLPLRSADHPLRWDEVGVEAYGIENREATLLVLYTGDPTAMFAALALPPEATDEERFELAERAYDFILECGIPLGRPEPPPEGTAFVRLTDQQDLRRRLLAGIEAPERTQDLLAADCPEDRPNDLSFEALAGWALGHAPEALQLQDTGKTPGFACARVYRHREHPLATVLALVHSGAKAVSIAAFCPVDLPDDAWPEFVGPDADARYEAPEPFERLSGEEARQQLRRALTALWAEGGIGESYPVLGEPTAQIQRAITRVVAVEREVEFRDELLSFSGLVQTWAQREEEQAGRPVSFVAQHTEDPGLLMIGGTFPEDEDFRAYLVADADAVLDPLETLQSLNDVPADATISDVLEQTGFEALEAEEAREALVQAVSRLTDHQAQLYDLAPSEIVH